MTMLYMTMLYAPSGKTARRPKGLTAICLEFFPVMLALLALAAAPASAQQTYEATESGCGPNSIWQAVQNANASPGVDTIEILAGATFGEASMECESKRRSDQFLGTFTESAIVKGNGARVKSYVQWIRNGTGRIQPGSERSCPDRGDSLIAISGTLFEIGRFGQDNSAIVVEVDGFNADGVGALFEIRDGATLIVSNARYDRVYNAWDENGCFQRPAVGMGDRTTFTARDVEIHDAFSYPNLFPDGPTEPAEVWYTIGDMGARSSRTINLERVRLSKVEGYAVANNGPGSTTNIVSSFFDGAGGIYGGPGTTTNIVNTAWIGRDGGYVGSTNQVRNAGTMHIEASTFWVPNTSACEPLGSGFLEKEKRCPFNAIPFVNETGATMTWRGTAIETDLSPLNPNSVRDGGFSKPLFAAVPVTNLGDNWLRPSRVEADIWGSKLQLGPMVSPQPAWDETNIVERRPRALNGIMPILSFDGTGVLIDKIDCNANPLVNPIDTSTINKDVFGNDRCDGNGKRNIGAVQTQTAPHLLVSGVDDGRVDLTWAAPTQFCASPLVIGGYKLYRRTGGGIFDAPLAVIDGSAVVTYADTSAANGETYEYEVTARCGIDSGGFIEVSQSQASNIVAALPLGPTGTPVVTAVPGDGEVQLSWPEPDLGGRTLLNYFIVYFQTGMTDYGFEATTDPLATIAGLQNAKNYTFWVFALTTDEKYSDAGIATATPHGDVGQVNRTPTYSELATRQANQPRYWEDQYGSCTKYEVDDDFGSVWTLADPASALVLKSDLTNEVWENPEPGMYGTASAKDISHVIMCVVK